MICNGSGPILRADRQKATVPIREGGRGRRRRGDGSNFGAKRLTQETGAYETGFVRAILVDSDFDGDPDYAADEGFSCVEINGRPPGKAERRYAGVAPIDVVDMSDAEGKDHQKKLAEPNFVISGSVMIPTC